MVPAAADTVRAINTLRRQSEMPASEHCYSIFLLKTKRISTDSQDTCVSISHYSLSDWLMQPRGLKATMILTTCMLDISDRVRVAAPPWSPPPKKATLLAPWCH